MWDLFQFKVKMESTRFQQWEQIPVILVCGTGKPTSIAYDLLDQFDDSIEVRFNKAGSYQGHYVS